MRDANVFSLKRALPRMSWNSLNLYNLWRRQLGKLKDASDFSRSNKTLFQQRWMSKQLIRAFHGDFINEKAFKRWYLPKTLPDVRPRSPIQLFAADDVSKFARGEKAVAAADKARRAAEDGIVEQLAPVGSLMFSEIERRLDVLIFRSCLARSVYDARRLVVHGYVLLNGKKHQNPNTRLAPGDMVCVEPKMIPYVHAPTPENAAEDSSETADASSSKETAEKTNAPEGPPKPIHSNYFKLPPYASPWLFIPAYLEVSFQTCAFVYVRHPTARPGYSEIPTPFDADGDVVRLAWEWYAKVRPRMRSKSQLAREPENRQ